MSPTSSKRPVAVFQHTEVGAPGTVLPILEELGWPVEIIRIVDGQPVPVSAAALSGLIFMGGYMGVDDNLPWIPQELDLIRDADARGIPVAGHCLGSQLVALALGGEVHKHSAPEIGWNQLSAADGPQAQEWWGQYAGRTLETFQWHEDVFVPPPGAVQLASAPYCDPQVYVVGGRHMLIQSHLEMTPKLVELSLEKNGAQLLRQSALGNPAVSSMDETRRDVSRRTQAMSDILKQLYSRWSQGLTV